MAKKKSKKKKHKKDRKRRRSSSSSSDDDDETSQREEYSKKRKIAEAKHCDIHQVDIHNSSQKDDQKKSQTGCSTSSDVSSTQSTKTKEREYRKASQRQGAAITSEEKKESKGEILELPTKSDTANIQDCAGPSKLEETKKKVGLLLSAGLSKGRSFPKDYKDGESKLVKSSSEPSKDADAYSKIVNSYTQGKIKSIRLHLKDYKEGRATLGKAVTPETGSKLRPTQGQHEGLKSSKASVSGLGEKPQSKTSKISFKIPKKINKLENVNSELWQRSALTSKKDGISPRLQEQSGSRVKPSPPSPTVLLGEIKRDKIPAKLETVFLHRQDEDSQSGTCAAKIPRTSSVRLEEEKQRPPTEREPPPETAGYSQTWSSIPEVYSQIPAPSSKTYDGLDNDQEMQLVEEIHLARSDKRLGVNVVESYGELTCMEIDPPEEETVFSLGKADLHQDRIIVLDTNILLSHLEFIKKMKAHGLGALGFPNILIPWVVLQELDALKNGKLSSRVLNKAIPAVNFIYTSLKKQEPRLWGQSMQQASQKIYGLSAENNDDRVLQCCLQYQSLYPGGAVILCTNDKNLCSKALLSGVKSVSKADLVAEVDKLQSEIDAYTYQSVPVTWHSDTGVSTNPSESETSRRKAAEASAHVSAIEGALRRALSTVLEAEMKLAFEDLWLEIVYIKPPWTLTDLLKCFKKHWIAVFGSVFQRNLLHSVEHLSDNLCQGKAIDRFSMRLVLQEAHELLHGFSCRSDYNGILPETFAVIKQLLAEDSQGDGRAQGENPVDAGPEKGERRPPASCDSDTLMTTERSSQEPRPSPDQIWAVFESIWNNVCQVRSAVFAAFQAPFQSLETPGPGEKLPPPEKAFSCLQNLIAAVKKLLDAFQRVLASDGCFDDVQTLHTFIASSEIANMKLRFTAQDLCECLSQQEYREKLRVGWSQLAELSLSLEQCSTAVCTQAGNWP
ncbi:transcriptional protein SWT1 [Amia ocellicauda]|uniref:transcriptional protein SWT1 n=1 Tax=Amia ocellicauda TaxID=2972642 RepID=UPI003463A9D9